MIDAMDLHPMKVIKLIILIPWFSGPRGIASNVWKPQQICIIEFCEYFKQRFTQRFKLPLCLILISSLRMILIIRVTWHIHLIDVSNILHWRRWWWLEHQFIYLRLTSTWSITLIRFIIMIVIFFPNHFYLTILNHRFLYNIFLRNFILKYYIFLYL